MIRFARVGLFLANLPAAVVIYLWMDDPERPWPLPLGWLAVAVLMWLVGYLCLRLGYARRRQLNHPGLLRTADRG
jgi:hypothetical protein